MSKRKFKAFVGISTAIYLLFIAPAVYANLIGNFKVSKKATRVHQRRTVGTGSRSTCTPSVAGDKSIELLVPDISIAHRTSSANPSLFLYARNKQPVTVNFTLVDSKKSQPLIENKVKIDEPGIVEISVSPNIQLKENNLYIWYIAIPCKNRHSQYQTVLNAGIERVILPTSVSLQLDRAVSDFDRIKIYGENGLWYETVNMLLKSKSEQEVDRLLVNNLFMPSLELEKDI